ncbi:juvenile hormone acid O-methyltransferase-like [Onthophagus taurus]|uniref:juvenile hormone acid O-methyltransferase-like n=1 Tax=Onthophagus taurus TaxID=166361 RepID=UPI000C206DED|nr:uncharacterized protein LOC111415261 [Onthophagus taurus]
MYDSVLFSDSNYNTVVHANEFLIKYEKLFNWTKSEDILEVGCANGCITKHVLYPIVKDHLHHLTGSDISQSAIDHANKINNNPNLSFETLDITNQGECDQYIEKFHRIFAFHVLHVAHKPELWSTNLYKMLKPNGQMFGHIIVSYPNFCNLVTSEQRNDQSKPWSEYMQNVRDVFYDFGPKPLERVKEIFNQAGFLINLIDIEPKKVLFKNIADFKNTWISANHILNHLPKELHDDYINDFLTKLLQHVTYNIDGSYEFTFDVLVFLVTKP